MESEEYKGYTIEYLIYQASASNTTVVDSPKALIYGACSGSSVRSFYVFYAN